MFEETMTLREALSTKKLLDSEIENLSGFKFITVTSKNSEIVNGLTIKEYEEVVKSRWQSLSAKIKRRDAIERSIMDANVSNRVKVPKFISLDKDFDSTDVEELSIANAIARKKYYDSILQNIIMLHLENQIKNSSREFDKLSKEVNSMIQQQLVNEFNGMHNVSVKNKEERQETLEEKYKVMYIDPVNITKNISNIEESVKNYLNKIDSVLGHATEVIEIKITY